MEPNSLIFREIDQDLKILRTGVGGLSPAAQAATRLPAGHPEGFIEAFANIYRNFARAVKDQANGSSSSTMNYDFPTIEDGVRGMQFIDKVIESSQSDLKWTDF